VQRAEFLRGLEHVVVDVEGCPHEAIITHQTSDVNVREGPGAACPATAHGSHMVL
jgi:hypothetical protein